MDPLDQVAQTLCKRSRLFMNGAALIVVSELLVVTSCLTSLKVKTEGRKSEEGDSMNIKSIATFPVQL